MKRKTKPVGRPKVEISPAQWKAIEEMASYGCSHDEIADYLMVSTSLFYQPAHAAKFATVTRRALAARKYELKKARISASLDKPLARTARWVDANILGWAEKQELSGKDGGPIELLHGGIQDLGELLANLKESRD